MNQDGTVPGINPNDIKKQMVKRILGAVQSAPGAEPERKLIAQFSLESGFGDKVIKKIIDNMDIVGMIELDRETRLVYPAGSKLAVPNMH